MGGSSSSSSSSSSVTNNKSSSIALDGDNNGFMLSGVENSGEIIFQQTDHGAIEAGMKAASEALEINGQVTRDAMSNMESTTDNALSSMESTTGNALDFGSAIVQDSLDTVQDTAARSAEANNKQLATLSELAKSVQTGGGTDVASNMTKAVYATMASIAVIGVVVAMKAKT